MYSPIELSPQSEFRTFLSPQKFPCTSLYSTLTTTPTIGLPITVETNMPPLKLGHSDSLSRESESGKDTVAEGS